MPLAEQKARHPLVDQLGEPVVVDGMVLLAAVNGTLLRAVAEQQRQPVTMTRIGVPELVPGHGDAVRTVGEVHGAVPPVVNIQMVEPDIACPGGIDGVRRTATLTFALNGKVLNDDIVAFDRDAADDPRIRIDAPEGLVAVDRQGTTAGVHCTGQVNDARVTAAERTT